MGKSSLMNMIAGAKVSIVDPTPGVTRDRVTAIVELEPAVAGRPAKLVEFVDTGGFGVYVTEGNRFDEVGNDLAKLTGSIEFQIAQAVEGADLVLFAVDAQAGITPQDQEIARLLREGRYARGVRKKGERRTKEEHKPMVRVRVVATKVDGPRWEAHAHELAALGFGEALAVSAKNNYFRRDFLDAVWEMLPESPAEEAAPRADLMLAAIGKRNAGKSTLVNTLAGEERVIASEIPGTTRDAVDVRLDFEGRSLVLIDTAGLRRKRSFQNMVEHYAFDRLQRSVDRCDVVLLLLDATEKISQVDEQLAMLAQKAFKPVVIVVNKWDLAEGRHDVKGRPVTTRGYEEYIRAELRGLWFAPIAFVSASSGLNLARTLDLAFELKEQSRRRVTTGKLNRLVRAIMETRGPSDTAGRWAKVYYVAQTGVEPPTITLVVNHPELFTANYLRFLMNRFREELPYPEVPIRIVVRARRQREDDLVHAAEGGEDAMIRVSRGRKGVKARLAGRRVDGDGADELGDRWLSEELSRAVDVPEESDDAEDYFDDDGPEPTRAEKAPRPAPEKAPRKSPKKRSRGR